MTYTLPELRALVAPFARPSTGRGVAEVLLTFGLFFGVTALGLAFGTLSVFLTVPFILIAGLLLVRLFILQHDAGHGSLTRSRALNTWIGRILATCALTPYAFWRRIHHLHHQDTGRLDVKRGDGVLWILTEEEFRALPKAVRAIYRLYHTPIVLFCLGPILYFMLYYRLWWIEKDARDKRSMLATNAALFGATIGILYLFGWKILLSYFIPIFAVAAMIGVWLFFVQHTFTDAYYAHDDVWDKRTAIMRGCSHYRLPRALEWATGAIGYHAIHHLNPMIPSYRLRTCYEKVKHAFAETPTFGIRDSVKHVGLTLWSDTKRRMVRFA